MVRMMTRDDIEKILKRMDETEADLVNLEIDIEDDFVVEIAVDLWKEHDFIETVVDLLPR